MKRSSSVVPAAPLSELQALYKRVDAALDGWGCASSTDCCRFGVTGREPYPTAVEVLLIDHAVRERGGSLPKRRALPLANERRCALLSDEGRCLIYAARPFGCRTFYCERAQGPVGERDLPRNVISEIAREIAALSQRTIPVDPNPRPLSRVTSVRDWGKNR